MTEQSADGGYAPMPGASAQAPGQRGPVPTSVARAVQLMFVSAALGVLGIILLVATKSALKEQILKNNPNAANIDTVVTAAITVGIVFGLIFTVLWLWLAFQVRKGKNWARIVTWVIAALGLLSAVVWLIGTSPALSKLSTALGAVLDLAIIVLLAQRSSSEYFARPV